MDAEIAYLREAGGKCYRIIDGERLQTENNTYVYLLNNDASKQIIVYPNHHRIINDVEPIFDRRRLLYICSNGFEKKIVLNQHL